MDSRGLITEANRKWWTLGAMCLSMFMIMLDSTVVNVALPSIQKDLDTSVEQLEWVVNGYTLSFAALLVTGGRRELHGRARGRDGDGLRGDRRRRRHRGPRDPRPGEARARRPRRPGAAARRPRNRLRRSAPV
jgi:hypothetical protein